MSKQDVDSDSFFLMSQQPFWKIKTLLILVASVVCAPECMADPSPLRAWTKLLGVTDKVTVAVDVAVDDLGNSYVVGNTTGNLFGTQSCGTHDAFLAKLDSGGRLVWGKQWGTTGEDRADLVELDANGRVIVGVVTGLRGAASKCSSIVIFDQCGCKLRQWQVNGHSHLRGMCTDGSGRLYVVASSNTHIPTDTYVVCYSHSGQTCWEKYLSTSNDVGNIWGITIGRDGRISVCGGYQGRPLLVQFDSCGREVKKTVVNRSGGLRRITVGPQGELVAVGGYASRPLFVGFSSDGDVLWERWINSSDSTVATDICVRADGTIITTGYTAVNAQPYAVFVATLEPQVGFGWYEQTDGRNDLRPRVSINRNGIFSVVGSTSGAINGEPEIGWTDGFVIQYE